MILGGALTFQEYILSCYLTIRVNDTYAYLERQLIYGMGCNFLSEISWEWFFKMYVIIKWAVRYIYCINLTT